jgi:tetraacyldisaccharide-1-P 4'-kinase
MNHKFEEETKSKRKKLPVLVEAVYRFCGFFNIKNEIITTDFRKAVCFSGIGDTKSFIELMRVQKIECAKFIEFEDHHNFTEQDLEKIKHEFKESKSDFIATTQKDFMRLKYCSPDEKKYEAFMDLLNNYPVYFASIKMEITKNELFITEKIGDLLKD